MAHVSLDNNKENVIAMFASAQDTDDHPNYVELPDNDPRVVAFMAGKTPLHMTHANHADAKAALVKSDIVILRCVEAGLSVPDAWVQYRKELRSFLRNPKEKGLPERPPYPKKQAK